MTTTAMTAYPLLSTVHLLANAMVLGGVFMNVFIVWPAARATLGQAAFPLEFLVNEGRRIAPWLYTALGLIFVSWIGLLAVHPPTSSADFARLGVRALAYAVMLGNTLQGTFRTWPALQFSTEAEAWPLWRGYVRRGRATFVGAAVLFALGAWQK